MGGHPLVSVRSAHGSDKAFYLTGGVAIGFGVSNVGQCVVLAVASGAKAPRLLVFRDDLANAVGDLSSFVFNDAFKVRLSNLGEYVLVSSHSALVVGSVSSATVVFRGEGRSASLSPEGTRVAFVDTGPGFVIRDLKTQESARFMRRVRCAGIGGWSPDGRYLFVGAFQAFSLTKHLLIVDLWNEMSCDLGSLRDGDDGSYCSWIDEDLLTR